MTEINVYDERQILEKIQGQARTRNFRVSIHGQQEMVDENIMLAEVTEAVNTAQVLENYPDMNQNRPSGSRPLKEEGKHEVHDSWMSGRI